MTLHEGKRRSLTWKIKILLKYRAELSTPLTDYSTEAQLKRIETRQKLDSGLAEIGHDLFKGTDWRTKFSEKTMGGIVSGLVSSILGDASEEAIGARLDALVEALEVYDVEQRVLIPLSGVVLDDPEMRIGPFVLLSVTPERLDQEIARAEAHFSSLRATTKIPSPMLDRDLEHARVQLQAIFGSQADVPRVVAEYRHVGDFAVAREMALGSIDTLIDVLRYCIHFVAPPVHGLTVGVEGLHHAGSSTVFVLPSNFRGSHVSSDQRRAIYWLELGSLDLPSMRVHEVPRLSSILRKPHRTEFELTIMVALHWFADSTVHFAESNSFLSLIACLETFFTGGPEDPVSRLISEGVAFVIGRDIEERKQVRRRVRDLYNLRSRITHGKLERVPAERLQELRSIVSHVMRWMIGKSDEFQTLDDLRTWIDGCRFSRESAGDEVTWDMELDWYLWREG